MKTLTLSRKRIEAAVSRGHEYAAQWRERFESESDWQWACIELARIPQVWARMGRAQVADGHVNMTQFYGCPAPCTDIEHQFPGYVMTGWSSGPREGWDWAHGASNIWNGIRRNLYCSLVEFLYGVVVGDENRRAQCESDLAVRWDVRVK